MKVNVQLREDGDMLRGKIEGEIDTFTAPILRDELETITIGKYSLIELDLSNVNYMDSTGIGVFVGFYKKVNREQGKLKLTQLSDRLTRLFEITGLNELIDIETLKKVELSDGNF